MTTRTCRQRNADGTRCRRPVGASGSCGVTHAAVHAGHGHSPVTADAASVVAAADAFAPEGSGTPPPRWVLSTTGDQRPLPDRANDLVVQFDRDARAAWDYGDPHGVATADRWGRACTLFRDLWADPADTFVKALHARHAPHAAPGWQAWDTDEVVEVAAARGELTIERNVARDNLQAGDVILVHAGAADAHRSLAVVVMASDGHVRVVTTDPTGVLTPQLLPYAPNDPGFTTVDRVAHLHPAESLQAAV